MLLLRGDLLLLLQSNMTNHLTTMTKAFPLIATWIFSRISTVISGMCIENMTNHGGKFFLQNIATIGWIQVNGNFLLEIHGSGDLTYVTLHVFGKLVETYFKLCLKASSWKA